MASVINKKIGIQITYLLVLELYYQSNAILICDGYVIRVNAILNHVDIRGSHI